MAAKVSPFAVDMPAVPAVAGVRYATTEAGIRYKNRTDLMLAVLAPGSVAAGVLTTSKTASAPVEWCRAQLRHGAARVVVVNSGNSNAFTGRKGRETVKVTAEEAAKAVGCRPEEVYIASTGVIGEPFDAGRIAAHLPALARSADAGIADKAARAIMTTDTYPKLATRTVRMGDADVVINGFCKGAGMIAPDMATMLAFLFTDAAVAQPVLQQMMVEGAARTFNCITVDSDTSTSDTLLLFATGEAAKKGAPRIEKIGDPALKPFRDALDSILLEMALMVVKDGEGITKFVTVEVSGAESAAAAKRIGMSIANSPLLKTAIAGEDPNWGRVVMAVGKAGEAADRDRLSVAFGPHQVARDGERVPGYSEPVVAKYMKGREIVITVDVGIGKGRATVWTCDLTHDYVSINADYRS